MNNWHEVTGGKIFITDLGDLPGKNQDIKRYAVWVPDNQNLEKYHVVEVSDDLQALMEKYQVTTEYILRVQR